MAARCTPELTWDDFVDGLARWVRRTFYWSDSDIVEDAIQEACLLAWQLWRRWQEKGWPDRPVRYARRAVHYHLARWWRQEQAQREAALSLEEVDVALPCHRTADPALKVEVETLLARLSERERAVIERRVVREEPFAVIARDLGCSDAHARVLYQRARRKLREWWME